MGSLPAFDIFQHKSTTSDQVVQSLIQNGVVIIRNFVSQDVIETVQKDIEPSLNRFCNEYPTHKLNVMANTVRDSRTFMEALVMHPLLVDVCDRILSGRCKSWFGQKCREFVSKSQVSSNSTLVAMPGTENQPLHRDDGLFFNDVPAIKASEYQPGRDRGIVCFVASTKATKENGATRFIPGSHLQASTQPPPADETTANIHYAELERGDAMIMLNSLYHGASANTTDKPRVLYAVSRTHGYIRQEENQYLAIPKETMLSFPEETQNSFGMSIVGQFLGWVDLQSPGEFIKGTQATRDWTY
ncbi:hypothetical protein P175DRAFT_0506353 [Aspergillus ochraceoroseus IBT 24754]|uniref:Fe2OG dioxygenase domain-containing protein n=2 Tax=Aspergillus ochraceoroseus TaxID=138278 RepID=A0A2T5M8B6_9EURO|nr:uncharacterized protein P175DRAFT_0506353 [Aspergillus ochraceoroseus IBT 24754]KKK12905.1 hypothetical protein AOCH_000469 [Aspergillus ochraceoroseus]PTU24776.1 hypothetical protein P175DRAFT_0506353 [Aspergillus ochraceoroseus IBT 24754]